MTSDVTISSPANNQLLKYDSGTSKWTNATVTTALSSCTDVTITAPAKNNVLAYDGSKWYNQQNGTLDFVIYTFVYFTDLVVHLQNGKDCYFVDANAPANNGYIRTYP